METGNKIKLDSNVWTAACLNLLRKATRKHKFNFSIVAEEMQQYFVDNNVQDVLVTSELCRRVFAGDYYSESVPPQARPVETVTQPLPSTTTQGKDLTHTQIMDIIQAQEDESIAKQEKVFTRVLTSLRNDDTVSTSQASEVSPTTRQNNQQLFARVEEQKRLREERRKKMEQARRDEEERRELERQRESLRNRYQDKIQANELEDHNLVSLSNDSIDSKDIDFPDSHIDILSVNMKDVFESKEFDMILTELESDIASGGNIEGLKISSELAEMFKLLDEEPKHGFVHSVVPHETHAISNINTSIPKPVSQPDKVEVKPNSALPPKLETVKQQSTVKAIPASNPQFTRIKESRAKDFSNPVDKRLDSDDEDDDVNWRKMRSTVKKQNIS